MRVKRLVVWTLLVGILAACPVAALANASVPGERIPPFSQAAMGAGEWAYAGAIRLEAGESTTLDVKSLDKAGSGETVWHISNTDAATVSKGRVRALQVLTETEVRVTAERGGQSLAWVVMVVPKRVEVSLPDGAVRTRALVFDISEIGQSVALGATVYPQDADQSVRWTGGWSRVAKLDGEGLLTIAGKGRCEITATADNGATTTLYVIVADTQKLPYYAEVDKANQVVRVYSCSANGGRPELLRRMPCSTGESDGGLPDNLYQIDSHRRPWLSTIIYNVYVQYATRIYSDIYFHSIPYTGRNADCVDAQAYDELGDNVSHGCIRLLAADSKWIYENFVTDCYIVSCYSPRTPDEYDAMRWPETDGSWDPTDDTEGNPIYDESYTSAVG